VPSKNSHKEYEVGGIYHIYNRGVNKRSIFKTQKDYSVFISYLRDYLTEPPPDIDLNIGLIRNIGLQGVSLKVSPSRRPNNYFGEIELMAYCLMPNHFHLLVKQNNEMGINYFMRSVSVKYARYFNTTYKRVGHLFQDAYKAVKVDNEYQLTYLSKYIHRNPLDLREFKKQNKRLLSRYKYSSYQNYLGLFSQDWLKTKMILDLFSKSKSNNSYQNFVEGAEVDDITIISDLTMDID
jgi:putative transposase